MGIEIFCTFRVPGFHHWPDSPERYSYLRAVHRHEFWFKVYFAVSHTDRHIEFIDMKDQCSAWVRDLISKPETISWSCERWAREVLVAFRASRVECSEDGENGAVVSL